MHSNDPFPNRFDPEAPPKPDSGFFGMSMSPDEAGVIILPTPFEATVSYRRGTAGGPETIRKASHQLDFFDRSLGKPYLAGVATIGGDYLIQCERWNQEASELVDGIRAQEPIEGLSEDQRRVNDICRSLHERVKAEVDHWIGQGKLVIVVGGDHSVAFGSIAATVDHIGELGVLQIDAHADLRVAYEGFDWSHASVMHNVMTRLPGVTKLLSVGIRDFCESEFIAIEHSHGRIETLFDEDMKEAQFKGESFAELCVRIVEALPENVYISFDIDGLEPSLCPGTGTPVPGGLNFAQVTFLLKTVFRSGRRIVGLDLCEVAPSSKTDEYDGNVGARILYKLMGYALKSQGRC
jgi:agmatinase